MEEGAPSVGEDASTESFAGSAVDVFFPFLRGAPSVGEDASTESFAGGAVDVFFLLRVCACRPWFLAVESSDPIGELATPGSFLSLFFK